MDASGQNALRGLASALLAGDGAGGGVGGVNDIGLDLDGDGMGESVMTHDDDMRSQTSVGGGAEKAKKRIRE